MKRYIKILELKNKKCRHLYGALNQDSRTKKKWYQCMERPWCLINDTRWVWHSSDIESCKFTAWPCPNTKVDYERTKVFVPSRTKRVLWIHFKIKTFICRWKEPLAVAYFHPDLSGATLNAPALQNAKEINQFVYTSAHGPIWITRQYQFHLSEVRGYWDSFVEEEACCRRECV